MDLDPHTINADPHHWVYQTVLKCYCNVLRKYRKTQEQKNNKLLKRRMLL